MMWGPALGEKMAGLIAGEGLGDLPKEDVELARFGRERDPEKVEDMIALPFPKR
jgi:sarcosine oxidase subunit beta